MLEKRIQIRRDTSTNWTNINPILASGELGFITDTGRMKVGDGVTAFNSLAFIDDRDKYTVGEIDNFLTAKEDKVNKGVANGYPDLDATGKIPLTQLPDITKGTTTVTTSVAVRPASPLTGDKVFETDTGDSYIYNGTTWTLMADADWANVNILWTNIVSPPATATRWPSWTEVTSKPTTFTPSAHTHLQTDITNLHSRYTDAEAITAVDNSNIRIDGGVASTTF